MTLKEYKENQGLSYRQLGQALGMNFQALERYANGKVMPSLKTAIRISKATKGKVTLKSWETVNATSSN